MLDEPPLMVRISGVAGFMDDSCVRLQSERNQWRARGAAIRVKQAISPDWTSRKSSGGRLELPVAPDQGVR
jgi:hypothetical protein